MSTRVNHAFRLRRRPEGAPVKDDLEFVEEPVPEPGPGQALVRTCYVSVDPTSRVWMSDYRSYMPPSPLNEVMRSVGVGQVVESRRDDLPEGTLVLGWPGWQEYCLTDEASLIPLQFPFLPLPDPLPASLTAFLGFSGTPASRRTWVSTSVDRVQARPSWCRQPQGRSGRWPDNLPRSAAPVWWVSPAGHRNARRDRGARVRRVH
jgi:NADPH-dependent curcumin reductase CurA